MVSIDTEHTEIGSGLEDGLGVSSPTEGRVEDHAGRNGGEDIDDLVAHHRLVLEVVGDAHSSLQTRGATS